MSNLALGITVGSAMNSNSYVSYSGGGDIYIPQWLAIIMLITLIVAMVTPVIELYRKDSDLLETHWERLILGPILGICAWGIIALCVGLIAFICSFIF